MSVLEAIRGAEEAETIRGILSQPWDADEREQGWTALHVLVSCCAPYVGTISEDDLVELLPLAAPSGLDHVTDRGMTALQLACASRLWRAAETLIDLGCEVRNADLRGLTALHQAALFAAPSPLVEKLLARGARAAAPTKAEDGQYSIPVGATPASVAPAPPEGVAAEVALTYTRNRELLAAASETEPAPATRDPRGVPDVLGEVGERLGEGFDLEVYGSFDEQYTASEWARNPAAGEHLRTFAIDGAGGQFVLWRRGASPSIDRAVVFLGSDGEAAVLAPDLHGFLSRLAHGQDRRAMMERPKSAGKLDEEMASLIGKHFPGREIANPKAVGEAARALQSDLAALIDSLRQD